MHTEHMQAVVDQLIPVDPTPPESARGAWRAVVGAVQALMQEPAPGLAEKVYAHVLPRVQALVDRGQHDALTAEQIAIYKTPPGMFCLCTL